MLTSETLILVSSISNMCVLPKTDSINFSCYCGESPDCDATTSPFIFTWKLKNSNEVEKSCITIPLCHFHFNQILLVNEGEIPIAYGNTMDEAIDYILDYADEPKSPTCCGDVYSSCSGNKKKHVFVWHFKERSKCGNDEYMTTLPLFVCDHHFNEILKENDDQKPIAFGWDYWEAVDSIVAVLDKQALIYESMEQQIAALKPLIDSGMIVINSSYLSPEI